MHTILPTISPALARLFTHVVVVSRDVAHPTPSVLYGQCPAGETRSGELIYYYRRNGDFVARSCDDRGRANGPPWRGRGALDFDPVAWRHSHRGVFFVRPGVDPDEIYEASKAWR